MLLVSLLPGATLSPLLLLVAETNAGRCIALSVFSFCGAVALLTLDRLAGRRLPRVGIRVTALLLTTVSTGLWWHVYSRSPDGTSLRPTTFVSSDAASCGYQRRSFANLVPELDQLILGSYLLPALDRNTDWNKAARLRGLLKSVYREMRTHPEFAASGSAMRHAYWDLLGLGRETGHRYVYIPPGNDDREPKPALIFLHGSGGNFKAYMWALKSIADKHRIAVIAPSCGIGNWNSATGLEVVEATREFVRQNPQLDGDRQYLAGLSNGAKGVTRASHLDWEALFYVSPALEVPNESNGGRAALFILHGEDDERIPSSYITRTASRIRLRNPRTHLTIVPKEDHFLFFSDQEAVQEFFDASLRRVAGDD